MYAKPSLEERIQLLERSLRTTRRLALILSLLTGTLVSAAFVQRQEDDEIRTKTLVLMDDDALAGVVLEAGPSGSLSIQTPSGTEMLRLGGDPVRPVGDQDGRR